MKTIAHVLILGTLAMALTGCIGLSIGGGSKTENQKATLGQQLMDLQTAHSKGAINDAEYQAQREKLLQQK